MWDFISSSEFPETAEYYEIYYPTNLDDLEPEPAGAIEFKFRMKMKSKGEQEPIPGLQLVKDKEYQIECSAKLPMKPGDIIRFNKNPLANYTITDIEYIVDERNRNVYENSRDWPGYIDNTKLLLITVK